MEAPTARQALSDTEAKVSATTPAFSTDPIALIQAGFETEDLKLALRLREVELETKTKEVQLMRLRIRAMELERSPNVSTPVGRPQATAPGASGEVFDVSRHIVLVPPFRESEVDSFFCAFERI